jgi:hypothetical protein
MGLCHDQRYAQSILRQYLAASLTTLETTYVVFEIEFRPVFSGRSVFD